MSMRVRITRDNSWKDQYVMTDAGLLVPKAGESAPTSPDRRNFPKKKMIINMQGLKYQVIYADPRTGVFHARLIAGAEDRKKQFDQTG